MKFVGAFDNRQLRYHLPDVHDAALVLALSGREVGNRGKLPAITKTARSRSAEPLGGLLE